MGRAARWLKSLFGIKKEKLPRENPNSGGHNEKMRPSCGLSRSGRETSGLCHRPNTIPPNITPAETAWLKSFYSDSEKEQNKHAIAVAAATAAAADAAVAAAQAAVAVVRFTSQGRGTMFSSCEKWAAIKIQTVFRGYLARKAHRALKGLVRVQALVRGYLVRRQATATLHSMQALIRAQTSVRAQRTSGLINISETSQPQFPARKSVERFDEASHNNRSLNSSKLSASFDSTNASANEESTKIVEVDTGRPKSRSRRTNRDSGDESSCQTLYSPRLYRPPRLSIPDCRNSQETDDQCRGFSTPQSTPRFASFCGTTGHVSPAKSASIESLFRSYGNSPNYMANTQSFKAKLRSHSAPKQRPEPGSKRGISIHQVMESRNSLSGVRMQRSCSQVREVLNLKNAVIGKLCRSTELVRQQSKD